ncbi:hypothetical protein EG328_005631 [Venturia inaequalis]|uniref:Uncharacterized protein n=1 Tax=Venturia inaequalis TaxID=5025 RepID=A0A8H3VIA6_VENIN|nr:hypothetical protein EG328_005631 [Venturia inaequalis]
MTYVSYQQDRVTHYNPPPHDDDIATYLRQNRTKQKASRRANPRQSAHQYQAATLAQQEAQRARQKLEERERLRSVAREKLAASTGLVKSVEVDEREAEGEMPAEDAERLRGESVDAGAMEVDEGDASLFCPMGEAESVQATSLSVSASARSVQQGQMIQQQGQRGQQPNQNAYVAPMAPMQPTTRRAVGPAHTPRQRDDNNRHFDNRRDDNVRNMDSMLEDTPLGRYPVAQSMQQSPSKQAYQATQSYHQANHFNQPMQNQSPSQAPLPTQTFDLATADTRKRKRKTLSNHQDMSSIMRSLERLDQQNSLDIASRDSEIMRLKLQLSDLRSLTASTENEDARGRSQNGQTMAQQTASLRAEVTSLRQYKVSAEYKIQDLELALQDKESEMQAADDWSSEKELMEGKMHDKEAQLAQAQEQVSRFMDAFNREAALRHDLVKKLESGERFNVKLSKDLKKKSEEVRLGGEGRERYVRLSGAVRGLFTHIQMETMSTEEFGDVGKALKRVRDLVFGQDEQINGGGVGR